MSMKTFLQKNGVVIVTALGLLITSQIIWPRFFEITMPAPGKAAYTVRKLTDMTNGPRLFAVALALIPIAAVIVWRYAPVITASRKLWTVILIVLAMTAAVLARREMIHLKAKNAQPVTITDYSSPGNPQPKQVIPDIPISSFKFELFAIGGLVAGSVLAFFAFRTVRK
jgi:hypothetical protein